MHAYMASSAALMMQQHQQQHGDGASSHGPPSPTSGGMYHVQPILGGQQGGQQGNQMHHQEHAFGLMSPTGDERGEWPMPMGPPTPSHASGEWVPLLSAQNAFGANNGSFNGLQLGGNNDGSGGGMPHGASALTLQQQLQQLSLSAPSNIIAGHHGAHLNDNSPVSSLSSDSNAVFLSGNLAALGNAAANHFNGSQYTGTLGGPAPLATTNSYSGGTATGSGNASHNSYNSGSNGNNVQTLYSTNEQMALARLAAQAASTPSAASHTAALSAAQQGALLGSLASLGAANASRGSMDYAAAFGAPQQLSSSLYIKVGCLPLDSAYFDACALQNVQINLLCFLHVRVRSAATCLQQLGTVVQLDGLLLYLCVRVQPYSVG